MSTKHILLKTPLLVKPILQSLNTGADFSQLAREHSACPSAENGGDWGNLNNDDLPQAIVDALQDAAMGEVVGPIETRHGLHLVMREH